MKNILKNTEKNIDRNKKPLIFVLPNAMKRAGKMDKTAMLFSSLTPTEKSTLTPAGLQTVTNFCSSIDHVVDTIGEGNGNAYTENSRAKQLEVANRFSVVTLRAEKNGQTYSAEFYLIGEKVFFVKQGNNLITSHRDAAQIFALYQSAQ